MTKHNLRTDDGTFENTAWRKALEYFMERRDTTQTQLAEQCGLPKSTINNYLQGIRMPAPDHVEIMCDVLGLEGNERESFLFEAHLAHSPAIVRNACRRLQHRVRELEVKLAQLGRASK